ncbi:hypothetical protein PIB30_044450 [Stylosanthes scabra]|uniref:Uncharacterized protein n=1 Tax=Stylosanthes scabra TaxID=79078 RepID=A0ABU6SFR1_9FABA|nr:hypothetical protein [Stylosanthes scabra]
MARGDVNVKPTNVPEDMDWVDDLVLLPNSVMDEELITSFRESHAVCGTVSEENQYELVPPNSEERGVPLLFSPYPTFFLLEEISVVLFRAREGRRIFTLYEESFHNLKNYYFKLRAVEGVRPFYENENGEYQFRLYWYSGPKSPKFDFDDLDGTDQEIVTVLSQCCARVPFNTKVLLTRSPSYIRTELGSRFYLVRRIIRRVLPAPSTENQSVNSGPEIQSVTEGSEFKVPKTPATAADQSKSKKRKGFGHSYGSVYAPDFDAVGFTDEFIMENSRIAMDEAGMQSNLEFMMKAGIKVADISWALQMKLIECPPTSRADLEQLKEKVAALEKGKEDAEGELSEAWAELTKMKKSAKNADCLRKKAEAEATELRKKVESLEVDLAKQKEEYEELEDDSIKSNDNIVENLRLQVKILVPTLKVHFLHPDNYVAGDQIVWCSDLLPESGGPFFEEEAAEVGDAEKSKLQTEADASEKTPHV